MENSELFLKLMDVGSTESVETTPMPVLLKAKIEPVEIEENEISECQITKHPSQYIWTHDQTLDLLELVKSNYRLLNLKNVKKRIVWQRIREKLNTLPDDVTYVKVEKKWKNMLYPYRKYAESLQSGQKIMRKPLYFHQMDAFLKDYNHANPRMEGKVELETNKTSWDETLGDEKSNSSTVSLPDESDEDMAEKKNKRLRLSPPQTAKDKKIEIKTITVSRSPNGLQILKSVSNNFSKRKLTAIGINDDNKKKLKVLINSPTKVHEDENMNLKLLKLLKDFRPLLKKKLINDKEMWEKIAEQLNISSVKCAKKWRDMVLLWQKYVQRDKSDETIKEPVFFKEIQSLVGENEHDDLVASLSQDSGDLERSGESSDEKEFSNVSSSEDEEFEMDKEKGDYFRKQPCFTHEKTLDLINLMKTYYILLADKRIKKRAVFEKILDEMEDPGKLTINKVENKWKNLTYKYNKYLVRLKTKAATEMREPLFFKELNAILGGHKDDDDDASRRRASGQVDTPVRSDEMTQLGEIDKVDESFPDEKDLSMSVNSCDTSVEQQEDEVPKDDIRLDDSSSSSKTGNRRISSLEQCLKDLVFLENQKFNFLVSESEKRHKFKSDFLSAINRRTESLNRLERKVDKLLKNES